MPSGNPFGALKRLESSLHCRFALAKEHSIMTRSTASINRTILFRAIALALAMLTACGVRQTGDVQQEAPPGASAVAPIALPTQRPPDPAPTIVPSTPTAAMPVNPPTQQIIIERDPSTVPTALPTAVDGLPSELMLFGPYDPQD